MPGFDRSGPSGQGPRTGRGVGPCASGWFMLRGRRRGLGRFLCPQLPLTREEKVASLTEYKNALVEELEDVEGALKNPDAV